MNIYVASSWKNYLQPVIVHTLREFGHEVYDFKNPGHNHKAFSWQDIDPNWQKWDAKTYRDALKHPVAIAGYTLDINALKMCDTCVLVLPSGRSASWEFGYAMGQNKRGVVVQFDSITEAELMYSDAEIVTNMNEFCKTFKI